MILLWNFTKTLKNVWWYCKLQKNGRKIIESHNKQTRHSFCNTTIKSISYYINNHSLWNILQSLQEIYSFYLYNNYLSLKKKSYKVVKYLKGSPRRGFLFWRDFTSLTYWIIAYIDGACWIDSWMSTSRYCFFLEFSLIS